MVEGGGSDCLPVRGGGREVVAADDRLYALEEGGVEPLLMQIIDSFFFLGGLITYRNI